MSRKDYLSATGMILAGAFVVHATRIIFDWTVVINGAALPMWASYIVVILAGFLSIQGFRLAGSRR